MDSGISPQRMIERARALGLSGVALTEHDKSWPPDEVEQLCRESGLLLINAKEWSTNMGHVIVIGPGLEAHPIMLVQELRKLALAQGAFMIMAHPFRYFPGPSNYLFGSNRISGTLSVGDLARHPAFELVDTLEVLNGGSTDRENQLAQALARHLGKQGTGGSDAHSLSELGRYATAFERDIRSQEELLEELQAGRFYPVQRTEDGLYLPLEAPSQVATGSPAEPGPH